MDDCRGEGAAGPRRRRVLAQLLAAAPAALLYGCGGGGSATADPAPDPAQASVLQPGGNRRAGLVAGAIQQVDAVTDFGSLQLLAVGRLPEGGHAVVWSTAGQDGSSAAWVRRFGANGEASGARQPLALPDGVDVVSDLAGLVRRDGGVVLAFVTRTDLEPGGARVRFALRTRHFDAAGQPVGEDSLVQALEADRQGTPPVTYFRETLTRPQLAQWDDGACVVAWQLGSTAPGNPQSPPRYQARRLDAQGQAAGPVRDLGASFDFQLLLVTFDEGGWLARTGRQLSVGSTESYPHFQFFDARHPLQLPPETSLPSQSWVLDLPRAGSVFFSGRRSGEANGVTAPYSQWYNPAGRAAGPAQPLPVLPSVAVALADGGYVAIPAQPDTDLAQRYTAQGRPLGEPFAAGAIGIGDGLAQGGMALAWTVRTATGTQLLTRRFDPA